MIGLNKGDTGRQAMRGMNSSTRQVITYFMMNFISDKTADADPTEIKLKAHWTFDQWK